MILDCKAILDWGQRGLILLLHISLYCIVLNVVLKVVLNVVPNVVLKVVPNVVLNIVLNVVPNVVLNVVLNIVPNIVLHIVLNVVLNDKYLPVRIQWMWLAMLL